MKLVDGVKRRAVYAVLLGGALASAGGLAAPGCGSSDSAPSGFSHGNDAAVDVFVGSDVLIWPDADPTPDAGPGPSPGFDAGLDAEPPIPTCADKTGEKGNITVEVESSGTKRSALLHVPEKYDATHGAMLVLNFHGFLSAGW